MSGRELRFARDAEDDLRSILEYSLVTWGARQQDERVLAFSTAFESILRFPRLGRISHEVDQDLRALLVGEHYIYYRVDEASVLVVRILHERMDVTSHL